MLKGVRERERSWLSLESCLSDCDPYVNITKFPGSSFVGLLSEFFQFGACKNKDLLHVRAPGQHSYIAPEKSEQVRENQNAFRGAGSVDCGRTPRPLFAMELNVWRRLFLP